MHDVSWDALEPWKQRLISRAIKAREFAHAPYSKFRVGAALVCRQDNTIYPGCNIENVMFEGVVHAEVATIVQAILQHRNGLPKIRAIAIALEAEEDDQHAMPCGFCRQWLREFGNDDTVIYGVKLNTEGDVLLIERFTLGELLPYSFGPNNLGK